MTSEYQTEYNVLYHHIETPARPFYRNTSSSLLFINCFSTVYKQFDLQKKKFSEIKSITAQTVLLDHEIADVPINETIEHICRPNSAACIYLCFHDTLWQYFLWGSYLQQEATNSPRNIYSL